MRIHTPIGRFQITSSDHGIQALLPADKNPFAQTNPNEISLQCAEELNRYFDGSLQRFSVPLDIRESTNFQCEVWRLLMDIPYGRTISYEELAVKYGDVRAIRAVAAANARNPLPIIIPCHRVVGKNGALRGYSLGLEKKKWLLRHERRSVQYGMGDQLEIWDIHR